MSIQIYLKIYFVKMISDVDSSWYEIQRDKNLSNKEHINE